MQPNDLISRSQVMAKLNRMIEENQNEYDCAKSDEWKGYYRGSCNALSLSIRDVESLPSNPCMESILEEMPQYFELVRETITSYDGSEKNGWIARINNEDSEIEAEFFAYTAHGAVSGLRDILSSN